MVGLLLKDKENWVIFSLYSLHLPAHESLLFARVLLQDDGISPIPADSLERASYA